MLESLKALASNLTPPLAPSTINAAGFPAAVQITWSEAGGAVAYQVYESLANAFGTGALVAVVHANTLGVFNTFLRTGLTDTRKRFYWVIPITALGVPGASSGITSAAATTVPLNTGAAIDNLTFGKLAAVYADAVVNGGQIDISSADVINKGEMLQVQLSRFASQSVTAGTLTLPDAVLSVNLGMHGTNQNLGLNPNWSVNQGLFTTAYLSPNGQVRSLATGADFRGNAIFKNSGFGVNQYAEVRIFDPDSVSNNGLGPAVLVATVPTESYYGVNSHGFAATLELIKVVAGAVTSLGTVSYTAVKGDIIAISAIGGTVTAFVNGVQKIQVSDSSLSSGQVGIHSVQSDVTSVAIDHFLARDANSGATVQDNFNVVPVIGAPKPVLLEAVLVVTTDATATEVTVQFQRDGGNLNGTAYGFTLPVSSTRTVVISYLDNGFQTGGGVGFIPPPLTPGVHNYGLIIGSPAGKVTLIDGFFKAVTPAG